ncbi:MAG: hypothetical protein ABSH42_14005 [Bryobacteraceae bacterium]|jgi:hypothetical protein
MLFETVAREPLSCPPALTPSGAHLRMERRVGTYEGGLARVCRFRGPEAVEALAAAVIAAAAVLTLYE